MSSTGGQGLVVSTLSPGTLRPDGTVDLDSLQILLNDFRNGLKTVWASGVTANRPTNPILSQLYYDTQTVQYLYCSAIRAGATAAVWTPFGTGAGGPAFGVVAVPTQGNVVATTTSDTLNLNAGSNVTITTTPGTKTVTISASGGGTGTVTSITATSPIVVAPSPITTTGVISHATSGVTAGTYGDSGNVAQITVEADGHVTAASSIPIDVTGWLFGTGRDGSLHFDGVNTFAFATKVGNNYYLKRSVHATDCLIDSGVVVTNVSGSSTVGGGDHLYCTGTLTCNGVLGADGVAAVGSVGGVSTPAGVAAMYGLGANGGAGGNPGSGAAGSSLSNGYGGAGGAGGGATGSGSNPGGAGGTVGAPPDADTGGFNQLYNPLTAIFGRLTLFQSPLWILWFPGAGGGGGGGRNSVASGGGGGGGGGCFLVAAKTIASGIGRLSCNGGAGAPPGTDPSGGGGGGGGGGILIVMTMTSNYASLVTTQANGGAGGLSGGTGINGTAGSAGVIVPIIIR